MCHRPGSKMSIQFVLSASLLLHLCVGLDDEICYNVTLFDNVLINFQDNITIDEPLYKYADQLNGFLQLIECHHFRIDGTTIYQKDDLTKLCADTSFTCTVMCRNPESNRNRKYDFKTNKENIAHGVLYFNQSQYTVDIKENSFPSFIMDFGGQIFQTDCYGKQSATRDIMRIEKPESSAFTFKNLNFWTDQQLDYEQKTKYKLELVYEQEINGVVERKTNTTLVVRVIDEDDMDPVFNHTSFRFNITENTVQLKWAKASPEISAYDGDFGEGRNNLTFSFGNNNTTNQYGFEINPENGTLKVTTELDREKNSEFLLTTKVTQVNDKTKTATASLMIKVLDENDNVPSFGNKTVIKSTIDEHSSGGTYIARVSATDKDEYPNNIVKYVLENYSEQLYVDKDGTVRVNSSKSLDREKLGDVIDVTVIAFDDTNGDEGGNLTLTITLNDINDHTPKFNNDRYDFVGDEVGIVGQVNATDKDDPINGNGEVIYALIRHFSASVRIDNKTGQINLTSITEFDVEFFVEACDNPRQESSKRCSQVQVFIRHNASAPIDDSVHASVFENTPLETIVTVINVKGTYYESVGENGPFKLDKERGAVKVNEHIDRENTSEPFTMNIHVKSKSRHLIANITLTIEILDANDNTPTFDKQDYFFELPDQLSPGTVIGIVNASDLDTGNNSRLHYYIPDSLMSPNFAINNTSGEIRISDHDFPEGKEFFQFPVSVKDNGIPSLQSACYVYISRTIAQGRAVQIGTPYAYDELQAKRGVIENGLNIILEPDVVKITDITRIRSKSYMHIEATNKTGTAIPATIVQRKVLQHMDSIQALFRQQTITTTHKPNDFGGSQIALIVLAVVILIGGIVLIYMIYKSRSHKPKDDNSIVTVSDEEKQTEEPTKLSETDNVSMQSIEITVDIGNERTNQSDQTSDYDGSQNAISESNAVGCINPAYQADTQEMVLSNDTMQGQATSKEVEHELNQLTDMLDEEEKKDGCSMEDQEESSLDVPKLYPSLPINETAAGAHHLYENTNVFPIQENENNQLPILCVEQEMHDGRDQDRKSSEFIMSSNNLNSNQGEMSERNNEKPGRSYENIVDVLDDEPDIDYNNKQVRFAAVVLDSEENKFEPIKDKEEEQTTEPNEDIDDIGDETVQNDNEDEHEEHGQLEYRPNDETTLQDVIETRSEESALEEEVTAF